MMINTHLFYHPDADYVRMMQLHALLTEAARIRDALQGHHHLDDVVSALKSLDEQYGHHSEDQYDDDEHHDERHDDGDDYVSAYRRQVLPSSGCVRASVVLMGDLNSSPDSPAIELALR